MYLAYYDYAISYIEIKYYSLINCSIRLVLYIFYMVSSQLFALKMAQGDMVLNFSGQFLYTQIYICSIYTRNFPSPETALQWETIFTLNIKK